MQSNILMVALASVTLFSTSAFAGTWSIDNTQSSINIGSVKNTTVGEVHTFSKLSGSLTEDGKATVTVEANSLETNIDIRNERIQEFVLKSAKFPTATFETTIDTKALKALKAGDATALELSGTMTIAGAASDLDAPVVVTKLSENRVLVTSDGFVMMDVDEFGLADGINKLRELASLDSIDLAVPLSFRLVYTLDK